VVQVFKRIGHRGIPPSHVWRETQTCGERLRAEAERQRATVAPERTVLEDEREDHVLPKEVSMDGGMVHIRGEGWKEFKAGVVYVIELRPSLQLQSGEPVDQPCARQSRYTAVLGDVEQFGPARGAAAVQHALPGAARSSVTTDGVEWIWTLAADLFPDSTQIVDW
jgi:hypothetical protein